MFTVNKNLKNGCFLCNMFLYCDLNCCYWLSLFFIAVYSAEHSFRLFKHREDYGAPRGPGWRGLEIRTSQVWFYPDGLIILGYQMPFAVNLRIVYMVLATVCQCMSVFHYRQFCLELNGLAVKLQVNRSSLHSTKNTSMHCILFYVTDH